MHKDSFIIEGLAGERVLKGELVVGGAKNAILPLMAAGLLFPETVTFSNVPAIEDVDRMSELLRGCGVTVERAADTLRVGASTLKGTMLDRRVAKRLRASILLVGPLLAREGEVEFPHPGGCVIGERPIDLFLDGFRRMGAEVNINDECYAIKAKKLKGADIFFRLQSVTATETFLMTAVLAEGETILHNVALEPEVTELAEFLKKSGALISGIGTPTIRIEGGGLLRAPAGTPWRVIADRIEAGSFMILGALAARELVIRNCEPKHSAILIDALRGAGVPLETGKDFVAILNNTRPEAFLPFNVKTHEYPGFPTDLQAPATVFLTQVAGESVVFETIFDGRLNYTEDLVHMGADIKMWDTHRISIKGPTQLKGRELNGPDIRAGLAFVIAALVARGQSRITSVYYIDRGYSAIEKRLQKLGANIKRVAT